MYIFLDEPFDLPQFFQNLEFEIWNPCDVIKPNLGQKETKIVYYIQTVIERSGSITIAFSSLGIHF